MCWKEDRTCETTKIHTSTNQRHDLKKPGLHQTGPNIPCQLHTITSGLWSKGGWEIHQIRTSMSAGHQWKNEKWCFKVVGNWKNKYEKIHPMKLKTGIFLSRNAVPVSVFQQQTFHFLRLGHVGNCAGSWKSQPLQVILLLQPIVDDVSVNNYVPWKTTSSNWVWEFSIHILS